MKVSYNAYGLVKEIRDGTDKLRVRYDYDDRGNRLIKEVYNADEAVEVVQNITYYIYDAAGNVIANYFHDKSEENTQPFLAEVPVYGGGRVGVYKPLAATIFYEVSDHLGNVRGVIGSPETLTFTATMEDNGEAAMTNPRVQEMEFYKNLSTTTYKDARMNKTDLSEYTPSAAEPVPVYSSYLKWIDGLPGGDAAAKAIGPSIGLKVEPGDKIDIEVFAKYKKVTGQSYPPGAIVGAMASILAGNFVGTASGIDVLSTTNQVFTSGIENLALAAAPSRSDQTIPQAYVNAIVFDRNFNVLEDKLEAERVTLDAGFEPGDEAFSTHEELTIPTITITEPGYIYIYVSNESENTEVWFDDLSVTHQRSTNVAGADYYPFGLVMENREITREDYRYGYQGQYSEKDKETGWNNFDLRFYDAKIARWLSADPYGQYYSPYMAMGNIPHMSSDTDGGWSWPTAGAGFVAGAAIGYAASDGDWRWTLVGGIAGGALSGASFNQSSSGAAAKFNGGFRETGGLSISFNNNLYASVGNFIQSIDLFSTALTLSKHAFSTIARRQAEEYFVRKNYRSPDHSKLRKDYRYTADDDLYSGFEEANTFNVNQLLGNNPGPYKGKDPDTGDEVRISRVFPKVDLNISRISKLTWIGGYGINSAILEGWGYQLLPGSANNSASLTVAFRTKASATKFYNNHFTKSFNRKMAEMQKRYFKVHK